MIIFEFRFITFDVEYHIRILSFDELAVMKAKVDKKKIWTKPVVLVLNIKKDTFNGSGYGAEGAGKAIPVKS